MPLNYICDDCSVFVEIGDYVANGAAITGFGAAIELTKAGESRFRQLTVNKELEKENVKGAGDPRKRHRFHSEGETARLTGLVSGDGTLWYDYVGYAVRITARPHSSLTAARTWVGVVESVEWDTGNSAGDTQTEQANIDLTPDTIS